VNEVEVVAGRVLADLDALLERLGRSYQSVPEYNALGGDVMTTEVLPVSREIIGGFLRAVVAGREPAVGDATVVETMGRRRLELGVPLEPMLHVFRIAGREVFDAIVAATAPGEEAALAALGRAWMDYIDQTTSVATTSYLDASHERLRRIDAQRGALLQGLLSATDAPDLAAVASEFAVAFAAAYVPVLVAAEGVTSGIDRIAAICAAGTLSGFRAGNVLLLVPGGVPDLAGLQREAPGATIAHGRPAAAGRALASELRQTEVLLAVAMAVDRAGAFGPDDLLVDQLLATNQRVAAALDRLVLAPLRLADRSGVVEATLRVYLDTGSVPATAKHEVVHPNTVSYRLHRVAERTGYDPRVPVQAAVLVLALAASSSGL
jgi:hypothetical protein